MLFTKVRTTSGALLLAAISTTSAIAAKGNTAALRSTPQASLLDSSIRNIDTDTWTAVTTPLSVNSESEISGPNGASLKSFALGSATWVNSDSGLLTFSNGWNVTMPTGVPWTIGTDPFPTPFEYKFRTDSNDARLQVSFNIVGIGDTFGLQGWSIRVFGGPEIVQALLNTGGVGNDPTVSGTFVANLTPDQEYWFEMWPNSGLDGRNGGLGTIAQTSSATMNAELSWSIQPIPEPRTAALFVTGLFAIIFLGLHQQRNSS